MKSRLLLTLSIVCLMGSALPVAARAHGDLNSMTSSSRAGLLPLKVRCLPAHGLLLQRVDSLYAKHVELSRFDLM